MKASNKMLLQFVTLNVIFAVTWAAAIPADVNSPQESESLSIKDTLCSENATLNIRVVCPTISGTSIDSSDSTLKNFKNLCDHAVYLTHSLCNYTQSEIKSSVDIADNVTALLSQKVTDDDFLFCAGLHKSQTDYWANASKSEIINTHTCGNNCISPDGIIKPLCRFVQWSWNFLFKQPKGPQEPVNTQAPSEPMAGKKDKGNQATANLSGNKPDNALQAPPGSVQEPELVNSEKLGEELKGEDHKNSPLKDQSPLVSATLVKDQSANPSANNPDLGPPPGALAHPPVSQPNRPSEHDEEDLDIKKTQVKPATSGKDLATNPDLDDKRNQELPKLENEDDNASEAENPVVGDDLPLPKPQSPDQKNGKELKAGMDEDIGGDERAINEDDEDEADEKREPAWPKANVESKASESLTGTMDEYEEADDSHFFVFFFIATFICIVFYLIYQNKRKIIAIALEGKKGRHTGRRRPTSASYQKLDNKLDEVMASSPPPSKTHVIY